ncbi:MAG TPA: hypothetical protein VGI39_10110 [Polyangiaceae bacterium]|jgi:modulator of FtsH protease
MSSPTAGWENFFVAEVGAAAALSGLIFVSLSISLRQIVGDRHLRDRAVETLTTFLAILAIATCGLIPAQSALALGAEIAGVASFLWFVAARRHLRAHRDPKLESEARRRLGLRVLAAQASTLPLMVGGGLLAGGYERGLYWVAPGVIASFAAGAFNAWVLLVEIQH